MADPKGFGGDGRMAVPKGSGFMAKTARKGKKMEGKNNLWLL